MTIQAAPGLTEVKQRARASWAAGDFPAVAKLQLWVVGNGWYAGWGSAGTRTFWTSHAAPGMPRSGRRWQGAGWSGWT
jgi:hypothetical protein